MTEKSKRRAELIAGGMTYSAVAKAEGVTIGAVRESVESFVYKASRHATPGTPLPSGATWHEREAPARTRAGWTRWYVSIQSRNADTCRWALAIREKQACSGCGRPL